MRQGYNIIYYPKDLAEEALIPIGALVLKAGETEPKRKTASGIESIATTSTVSSALASIVVNDWQANISVALNEVRRATVSAGTIELGDIVRSNSARTTGSVFDATEAGNWTEFSPDIVTSVASKTGAVSLVKDDVGLGSVDNVADISKPVSTAQQTALDGKSATTHNHTGTYEPSNANIQSHVTAAHAPAAAEQNVNPDWNQATTTEDDFIKNKPTIPAAVTVNNTLASTSTTEALSAAQGKTLQDGKQDLYEGTVALRTPNNLTSNTSDPNYILTASSEHTVHLFYRAFDGNDANHWYTAGTTVANGVIELRYKIRPTNLLLRGETTILEYWTRWQLQGSNNGTTWDTLVDRSGVDEVIQNTSKNFPITTTKEYKYFRFNGLNAVGTNIPLSRLEISGVESERNFIDWTSYTPIVTSESGAWSNYTATGRYRIVDKMLTVSFRVIFTGTSTGADGLYVSIPSGLTMNASVMTGGASWDTDLVGLGILGDSGTVSGVPAIITTRTSLKVLVKYYNAAASSYLTCPGLNNAAPWIWTTQDTVDGQFTVPIL